METKRNTLNSIIEQLNAITATLADGTTYNDFELAELKNLAKEVREKARAFYNAVPVSTSKMSIEEKKAQYKVGDKIKFRIDRKNGKKADIFEGEIKSIFETKPCFMVKYYNGKGFTEYAVRHSKIEKKL